MRYGFTGTRKLREAHVPIIMETLKELSDGTEFVTGAARGVDTFVARALTTLYPDAVHRLIVPAAPHNEDLVTGWLPNGTTRLVEHMRPARNDREAYRARNGQIVASCDRLVAFARLEEDRDRYSGTWMTVRIGRKDRKVYRVVILEPEDGFERDRVSPRGPRQIDTGRGRTSPARGSLS